MKVPRNVLWFEALLYASLMLDALSVAFQDRTPTAELTEQMILAATMVAGAMILLLVYFVWLAARQRKNWPRWVLAAALLLSVISLFQVIGENGLSDLELDPRRIGIALRNVVHCDREHVGRIVCAGLHRIAQVVREGGDAALPRHVIAQKRYLSDFR